VVVEVPLLDIGVVERLYRESPTGCQYNNVLPVNPAMFLLSNVALRGMRGNISAVAGGYKATDECILVDTEGVSSVSEVFVSVRSGAVVSETVSDVGMSSVTPVEGVVDTSAVQAESLVVSLFSAQFALGEKCTGCSR